jgi:hypothetical protein
VLLNLLFNLSRCPIESNVEKYLLENVVYSNSIKVVLMKRENVENKWERLVGYSFIP